MTDSSSEKVKLLSMLAEIHNQLEELESVLEVSFSDHRKRLNQTEQEKILTTSNRLTLMENKFIEKEMAWATSPKVQNLKLAFK